MGTPSLHCSMERCSSSLLLQGHRSSTACEAELPQHFESRMHHYSRERLRTLLGIFSILVGHFNGGLRRPYLEGLDDLHGNEQRDGDHVREEQPEGDAVHDPENAAVAVVALRAGSALAYGLDLGFTVQVRR